MTLLQLAVGAGCLVGLGVTLILWRLVPAHPHLGSALERLDPARTPGITAEPCGQHGPQDRVGLWVQRHAPAAAWCKVPTRELAILHIPVHRYLGEKALYAVVGLLFPVVATVLATLLGLTVPFLVPAGASVVLAIALSFIPDYNARDDATRAREEFTRGLGAYIDLVALERAGGAGSTQALETAAEVADSWVFERIREELARARWAGQPPWDGLAELAEELGLPELSDLADIMRLSGDEGATVYQTLRARSASLRTALLTDEHAKANAAGEKMTLPVSALALIFLVLLATPAVIRVVFGA
jgi:Flp pilus assembly protein TadB